MILIVSAASIVFAPPLCACVTLLSSAVPLSYESVTFDVVTSSLQPAVVSGDMVPTGSSARRLIAETNELELLDHRRI